MWYTNFKKNNCKSCYACSRACPVNAIGFKNDQAQIIEDRCIVCDKCSKVCPQKKYIIKSEVSKVKLFLKNKNKIAVSLAPSFVSIFGKNSLKIPTVLRQLGFSYIEETTSAINPILDEYQKFANLDDGKNYFTSFCPTVNNLIEKHFPEFTDNIIPIVSPFLCHTRLMKSKYSTNTKVVFIGPCLSKKNEGSLDLSVDAVITFAEFEKWLKEENIDLNDIEDGEFDAVPSDDLLFPIVGETSNIINSKNPVKKVLSVEGIDDCISILKALKEGRFTNTIFEMNACIHSCLNGSGINSNLTTYQERKINIINYIKQSKEKYSNYKDGFYYDDSIYKVPLEKHFYSKKKNLNIPSSDELNSILKSMGKSSKKDYINCGGCGYKNCVEHAIAIYNNISEISRCSPYMRQKAENLTNLLFESAPFMMGIVGEDICVLQFNSKAEKFFETNKDEYYKMPILMYLDDNKFSECLDNKENVYNDVVYIDELDKTLCQDIFWVEDEKIFMWMARDITKDVEAMNKNKSIKINTVEMAQEVIDKQMRVAQEIGKLLGETTAETKVILNKVKSLINDN